MPRNQISFIEGISRLYAENRQDCEGLTSFSGEVIAGYNLLLNPRTGLELRTGLSDKPKHMGTASSVSTPSGPTQ